MLSHSFQVNIHFSIVDLVEKELTRVTLCFWFYSSLGPQPGIPSHLSLEGNSISDQGIC